MRRPEDTQPPPTRLESIQPNDGAPLVGDRDAARLKPRRQHAEGNIIGRDLPTTAIFDRHHEPVPDAPLHAGKVDHDRHHRKQDDECSSNNGELSTSVLHLSSLHARITPNGSQIFEDMQGILANADERNVDGEPVWALEILNATVEKVSDFRVAGNPRNALKKQSQTASVIDLRRWA